MVDTDLASPPYTSACDESIVKARDKNIVPNTLHFYRRNTPTVSLGYFEDVEEKVDLDVVREHSIHLVRRMSGGSAIYTDEGQLIYSVILAKEFVPSDPNETYEMICSAVIKAIESFGLQAEFKPINDILIGGKKVSGSAQKRHRNTVIQHGSLIVDTDFELMFKVLKTDEDKPRGREEMTCLREELGREVNMEEVKKAVVDGFSEVFNVTIEQGMLTHFEKDTIDELIEEKYGADQYTLSR